MADEAYKEITTFDGVLTPAAPTSIRSAEPIVSSPKPDQPGRLQREGGIEVAMRSPASANLKQSLSHPRLRAEERAQIRNAEASEASVKKQFKSKKSDQRLRLAKESKGSTLHWETPRQSYGFPRSHFQFGLRLG